MESPRIAVRVEGSTVAAPVKTACVSVDCAEKVPRRRKIAEGLSLESLCACVCVSTCAYGWMGGRATRERGTYMPRSWKPLPGQKKCTVAP